MTTTPFHSGFISVIGRPNVGKSTLLNEILGEKLLITSQKPQTTRNAIRCIRTDSDSQMVFIDTPGMTAARNKLGDFLLKTAQNSLEDVDAVVLLVEPDKIPGPGDKHILEALSKVKTPVLLAINKIDTVAPQDLLAVMDAYKQYDFIQEIIPISATRGDGVPILVEELKKRLPEGPEFFPPDMIVDQSERFIVAEIIREKILRLLKDEIPHGTAVEIMSMKARPGKDLIDIEANIYCERKSHKGMIIGKQGSMLKKIGEQARRDIQFFLKQPVNLQLWVKVRDNWRDKPFDLGELGYKD